MNHLLVPGSSLLLLVGCVGHGDRPLTALAAQQDPASPRLTGHLMGTPLGWTTNDGAIGVREPGLLLKAAVDLPAGVPMVDFGAFFTQYCPGPVSPISAISLGTEVIRITDLPVAKGEIDDAGFGQLPASSPVLTVGDHGWFAVLFTVDDVPENAGNDYAPDIRGLTYPKAAVFSYVLPDSGTAGSGGMHLLPEELTSTRVLARDHLGLSGTTSIDGICMPMGLYQTDVATVHQFTRRLPSDPTIYFTVKASALVNGGEAALRTRWRLDANTLNNGLLDAATILRSQWTNNSWSMPTVYKHSGDLQLGNQVAIDGLAMDTVVTPGVILFSLANAAAARDEIQMVPTTGGAPRRVLVKKGPKYTALGTGLRGGTAIGDFCTADPWFDDPTKPNISDFFRSSLPDDFEFGRRKLDPDAANLVALPITALRAWDNASAVARVVMSLPDGLSTGSISVAWALTDDITTCKPTGTWTTLQLTTTKRTFYKDLPLPTGNKPLQGLMARWTYTVEFNGVDLVFNSPIAVLRY